MDPHFKTMKDTTPEFTEIILDMDSVFEFELLVRWVPKESDTVCRLCLALLCRIVSPAETVSPTTNMSPQISEADKTSLEMQDWLQMTVICDKNSIGFSMSIFLARNK